MIASGGVAGGPLADQATRPSLLLIAMFCTDEAFIWCEFHYSLDCLRHLASVIRVKDAGEFSFCNHVVSELIAGRVVEFPGTEDFFVHFAFLQELSFQCNPRCRFAL